MSQLDRNRRLQRIRYAEGCLDLVMACGEVAELDREMKEGLASKALESLAGLESSTGRRAHIYYLRGQAYRIMEDYEQSISALKAGLEFDSQNVHIFLALGWCYKRIGKLNLAITVLDQARQIQEDSGIINYNLACYYALAGDVENSVFYLSAAMDIDSVFRELIHSESDFDQIRMHPEFQAAISVVV